MGGLSEEVVVFSLSKISESFILTLALPDNELVGTRPSVLSLLKLYFEAICSSGILGESGLGGGAGAFPTVKPALWKVFYEYCNI